MVAVVLKVVALQDKVVRVVVVLEVLLQLRQEQLILVAEAEAEQLAERVALG